ncbi:MAG: hypothetical protein AAF587_38020 [Bacteroidota bacterium]
MKQQKLFATTVIALFFLSLTGSTQAQDEQVFFMVDYMKVTEGMNTEYLAGEQGVWKSIHETHVKKGVHHGWSLYQIVVPGGSEREYDYVTVTRFVGEKAVAEFMSGAWYDEAAKTLTDKEKEEMMMTGKARKRVRSELSQFQGGVFGQAEQSLPRYLVVNYIKLKEGISSDQYRTVENEIWKPMHEARIKDGHMRGWFMTSLQLPFGSSMPYECGTVDQFDNLEDMMTANLPAYFAKTHPDKDVQKAFQRTSDARDIVKGDIWELIDYVQQ